MSEPELSGRHINHLKSRSKCELLIMYKQHQIMHYSLIEFQLTFLMSHEYQLPTSWKSTHNYNYTMQITC